MTCRTVRNHMDAFLDGEVDPTTQIEFERHIASCAGCQEMLVAARILKHATRSALTVKAPDALKARVAQMMAQAEPVSREPLVRVFTLPARYSLPMAAAALLAFILGGVFVPRMNTVAGTTDQASAMPIFRDVVQLHSNQLPADVSSNANNNDQQVVSWFRGKLEFPVRPAAFDSDPDVHLLGARLSNVGERRAAALYYDVHGRRMTVVVFPGSQPVARLQGVSVEQVRGRPVAYQRIGGYTVSTMEHDGITYAITGDMDQQTLLRLAASAKLR